MKMLITVDTFSSNFIPMMEAWASGNSEMEIIEVGAEVSWS